MKQKRYSCCRFREARLMHTPRFLGRYSRPSPKYSDGILLGVTSFTQPMTRNYRAFTRSHKVFVG